MLKTRDSVQQTLRETDWVTTQVIEATIEELSNVSLADAATIVRAAITGQPIDAAPVARLVVLGVRNLGLVVYDYLAPAADAPPPGGKPSPSSGGVWTPRADLLVTACHPGM